MLFCAGSILLVLCFDSIESLISQDQLRITQSHSMLLPNWLQPTGWVDKEMDPSDTYSPSDSPDPAKSKQKMVMLSGRSTGIPPSASSGHTCSAQHAGTRRSKVWWRRFCIKSLLPRRIETGHFSIKAAGGRRSGLKPLATRHSDCTSPWRSLHAARHI